MCAGCAEKRCGNQLKIGAYEMPSAQCGSPISRIYDCICIENYPYASVTESLINDSMQTVYKSASV